VTDVHYAAVATGAAIDTPSPLKDDTRLSSRRRAWLPCSLAALLAAIVYLNVFGNPFIYDDYRLIVENRTIVPPLQLQTLIQKDPTRPVANISFAIDRALLGPAPVGFHLTNVALHVLNVVLFFILVHGLATDRERARKGLPGRRTDPVTIATIAATLFAIHPMMTEAVGYISGRSDVLSTMWFLSALMAARRWMLTRGRLAMAAMVVLLVAALATKEIAAMFALVVLAIDRLAPLGTPEDRARRLKHLHIPLLIVTLAVAATRVAVLLAIEHADKPGVLWSLLPVELDVIGRYLGLLLLPVGQSISHEVAFPTFRSPGLLVTIGLIAWCLWQIWRPLRRDGLAVLGVLWFLLLLVPSSALVLFDHAEPMSEHRVYLASCGFFLLVGAVAARAEGFVFRRPLLSRIVIATGMVAALSWLGARAILRNAEWGSPIAIWSDAVDLAPNAWVPRLALGESLHRADRHDEAIAHFAMALQRHPQEPAIYAKLATCFAEVGKLDEARQLFTDLQRIAPGSPEATNGLGTVSLLAGDPAAARRFFLSTLDREPGNIAARLGLASVAEAPGGSPAEAIRWCEEVQRLAPDTAGVALCLERNRKRAAQTGPGAPGGP
jgi:tetratricopeptide (TPR) repeat protein